MNGTSFRLHVREKMKKKNDIYNKKKIIIIIIINDDGKKGRYKHIVHRTGR